MGMRCGPGFSFEKKLGGGMFAMRFGAGGPGGPWGWDGGEFGGGARGGPRGSGRRRMFESGQLRLVLLKLIADQPRHGYDLIRAIEEMTHGSYAPSPGVVYPTLTLLQDMGLIEEAGADGRARRSPRRRKAGAAGGESGGSGRPLRPPLR
jgi:hypothetical protein